MTTKTWLFPKEIDYSKVRNLNVHSLGLNFNNPEDPFLL